MGMPIDPKVAALLTRLGVHLPATSPALPQMQSGSPEGSAMPAQVSAAPQMDMSQILSQASQLGQAMVPQPSSYMMFDPQGGFAQNHPTLAHGLENALIAASSAGPGVAGGLQGLGNLMQVRAAQRQAMSALPNQRMQAGLQMMKSFGDIQESAATTALRLYQAGEPYATKNPQEVYSWDNTPIIVNGRLTYARKNSVTGKMDFPEEAFAPPGAMPYVKPSTSSGTQTAYKDLITNHMALWEAANPDATDNERAQEHLTITNKYLTQMAAQRAANTQEATGAVPQELLIQYGTERSKIQSSRASINDILSDATKLGKYAAAWNINSDEAKIKLQSQLQQLDIQERSLPQKYNLPSPASQEEPSILDLMRQLMKD